MNAATDARPPRFAGVAWANAAKMIPRVNPRGMPVIPRNVERIVTRLFDAVHLNPRRVHGKRAGRRFGRFLSRFGSVGARAGRARAPVAQIFHGIGAVVPVFPVDIDAARFRYGDMFRICGLGGHDQDWWVRSTSRMPEIRRIAVQSFSSCFLSLTSTVISTMAASVDWLKSVRASRLRTLIFSSASAEVI